MKTTQQHNPLWIFTFDKAIIDRTKIEQNYGTELFVYNVNDAGVKSAIEYIDLIIQKINSKITLIENGQVFNNECYVMSNVFTTKEYCENNPHVNAHRELFWMNEHDLKDAIKRLKELKKTLKNKGA